MPLWNMCLSISFQRTSLKFRVFLGLCLTLSIYMLLFDGSSVLSQLNLLIPRFNQYFGHQVGEVITAKNGTFLYFHLPSLNDYNIENDYFRLSTINIMPTDGDENAKYCLRKGSDVNSVKSLNPFFCVCKSSYFGNECAVPSTVHQTLQANPNLVIQRNNRPRRILMSLIWLSGHQDNQSIALANLAKLYDYLGLVAPVVDFFIIHEVGVQSDYISTQHFANELDHGAFTRFKSFTLFVPSFINLNQSIDLNQIELELAHESWRIFTKRVTEYRPSDLLFFMSINNFPQPELLLFLKYHTGLDELMRLNPIHTWSLHSDGTLSHMNSSNQQSSKQIKTTVNQSSQIVFHLKNIVITFEYFSSVCRFSFIDFAHGYCLHNKQLVERFTKNFWKIQKLSLGSYNQKLSSTQTILSV